MKRIIILLIVLFVCQLANAQKTETNIPKYSLTIGVLQGGGSLLGFDLEVMSVNRLGVQMGIGFLGYGLGVNYHFRETVKSSFISLQYWHQGIGFTHIQSLVGPSYVFRAKKVFTFQIGVGFLVEKGEKYNSVFKTEVPAMLTYAIGFYIPWK